MSIRESLKLRIVMAVLVLAIAANIAISFVVFPEFISKRDLSSSSLKELAWAYEENNNTGRVVCVLFYETYRATHLVITEAAFTYLALEEGIYHRFCRVNRLTIVPDDAVPEGLSEERVAEEIRYGDLQALRAARFLAADGFVEIVYAFKEEDIVHFVPTRAVTKP